MSRRESVTGPGMEEEDAFRLSMKRLREERGWSQADLAKALTESGWSGIYQTTISRMEKGERPIRIGEARGIARVFGVTVGLMIAPTEERKPVEELKQAVDALNRLRLNLTGDMDRLTTLVSFLPHNIEAVEQSDYREWADADMKATIDRLLSRAREQTAWNVQVAVDLWREQVMDELGFDSEDSE